MTWYLVVFLLFALGVAVFAAQNGQTVDVRLLMWRMNTTLAVVVLGAAFAGAVITASIGAVAQLRLRWRLLRAENELRTLRQAVAHAGVPGATSPEEAAGGRTLRTEVPPPPAGEEPPLGTGSPER
ncbi:MAG: LapA family protein [Firmicutes bacterium]|nr:LapA family protein [Bacillota bacterium]